MAAVPTIGHHLHEAFVHHFEKILSPLRGLVCLHAVVYICVYLYLCLFTYSVIALRKDCKTIIFKDLSLENPNMSKFVIFSVHTLLILTQPKPNLSVTSGVGIKYWSFKSNAMVITGILIDRKRNIVLINKVNQTAQHYIIKHCC